MATSTSPGASLVSPPEIERPMGELLANTGITQLAISETQKYGHVTYFWNGNRSGMFDSGTETYLEIRSDNIPFDQRPWMKAAEITDTLATELRTGRHRFARSTMPTATWSATPARSMPRSSRSRRWICSWQGSCASSTSSKESL